MLQASGISVAPPERAKTIPNTPTLPSFAQPTRLRRADIEVSTSHQTQQKKSKKSDNDDDETNDDETTSSATGDDNDDSSEDDNDDDDTKDAITPATVIINFYLIIS